MELTDRDISELRAEYLFNFANLCGISPRDLDALRCVDFFQLIINIDAFVEANSKS